MLRPLGVSSAERASMRELNDRNGARRRVLGLDEHVRKVECCLCVTLAKLRSCRRDCAAGEAGGQQTFWEHVRKKRKSAGDGITAFCICSSCTYAPTV